MQAGWACACLLLKCYSKRPSSYHLCPTAEYPWGNAIAGAALMLTFAGEYSISKFFRWKLNTAPDFVRSRLLTF